MIQEQKDCEERRKRSLTGHFQKGEAVKVLDHLINPPCAFTVTLEFLDTKDILNLMALSKGIRKEMFPSYQSLVKAKLLEKDDKLKKQEAQISSLENSLKYLKEQDQVREQLVKDTDDERVQEIIFKYIVQPKRDKKAV